MPSGGLNVERSTTERELFGSPKQERLDMMAGKTVWLIGEHLTDYLAESARGFLDAGVAKIVLLTHSEAGAKAIARDIGDAGKGKLETLVVGDAIEASLDKALSDFGRPTTIVSTPFKPLPDALFEGANPLDAAGFADVVETNLTHHFRVARKVSLFDNCQLVLVSPDVPMAASGGGGPAFALANFVKTTLHAFTATLGAECERIAHYTAVNQVDLTRRARDEGPRTAAEEEEELERFVEAVLLTSVPLPSPQESRYRARIYRGNAITV
jgi:malonyl-CoA reductase/3-hydroxypropionate dehydrogenase (NADP+)